MTRLAYKLRNRMQILTPVITPNEDGGFDRGYFRLGTVWAGLEPISKFMRLNIRYIRDQQIERGAPTHIGFVRYTSAAAVSPTAFNLQFGSGLNGHVGGFGRQYSNAFDNSFRSFPAFTPLKSDYFMFLENGSGTGRGRLFRIYASADPQERREQIQVDLEEIEDHASLPTYTVAGVAVPPAAAAEAATEDDDGIFVGPIWDDGLGEWL